MSVDRRELFQIIGAGVASSAAASAQHQHAPGAAPVPASPAYAPRALTPAEYASLQRLLEVLLPADEASPSARDAGVARFIDTTLHFGDERTRALWKSGLEAIDRDSGNRPYGELEIPVATVILARVAEAEDRPVTDAARFFGVFKQTAIQAYYQSEGGRRSLGYKGDTAVRDFPGCTHPEHKST
ncbi:MAG: gluconate 2-dehydrogenase subunit 3 family protein [Bryobacteraceae bacterium]|nr:gluconate 2-dehydrogenase subunit 3 family protein [Bryobacteraceae bacterium]